MKKVVSVLLAAAVAMSITACGGKDTASEGSGAVSESKAATGGAEEQSISSDAPAASAAGQESSASGQKSSASGVETAGAAGEYPADINQWTAQNFIDYFVEKGVFYDGNGGETWIQDHSYWVDTPVDECAGWWTDDDISLVMIFIMNADNEDTSEEQLEEWKSAIKDQKTLPGEYASAAVDHLVGNVGFSYSTILDEEVYQAMDKAYEELIESLGAAPEF